MTRGLLHSGVNLLPRRRPSTSSSLITASSSGVARGLRTSPSRAACAPRPPSARSGVPRAHTPARCEMYAGRALCSRRSSSGQRARSAIAREPRPRHARACTVGVSHPVGGASTTSRRHPKGACDALRVRASAVVGGPARCTRVLGVGHRAWTRDEFPAGGQCRQQGLRWLATDGDEGQETVLRGRAPASHYACERSSSRAGAALCAVRSTTAGAALPGPFVGGRILKRHRGTLMLARAPFPLPSLAGRSLCKAVGRSQDARERQSQGERRRQCASTSARGREQLLVGSACGWPSRKRQLGCFRSP